MARRRRREEDLEVDTDAASSSTRKIKRRRKALHEDDGDKENMDIDSDELNCSQQPDFPVAAKVYIVLQLHARFKNVYEMRMVCGHFKERMSLIQPPRTGFSKVFQGI